MVLIINKETMADFYSVPQEIVKDWEGKYSNDKNDPGAETVWGLTRVADASWPGWPIVNTYKSSAGYPSNLPFDRLFTLALPFIKKRYWDVMRLDYCSNQHLANILFDISLNMGSGTATKYLQIALNAFNHNGKDYPDIAEDGIFGNGTFAAMQACKVLANVAAAVDDQEGYRKLLLAKANPTNEDFINGWYNRKVAVMGM